ncbi:MAG: DUF72 domain-containing protein [Acidobacteria bacterium]|nr:DUF72 domain-containing protein [Acidobacteriota bacterium]MBV9478061.1 DUF72 domain-containing protein [Acidobacteriota bacterium]
MNIRDYFETFPLVEVQQTFYEPPAPRTMLRWREQAPEGFEFTIKAWQLITHRSSSRTYRRLRTPLNDDERAQCGGFQWTPILRRAWDSTVEAARILRATAILFQCPASFRAEDANVVNLRRFFTNVERPDGVRFLWEPRGPWPQELIAELCGELALTHVVDPFDRDAIEQPLTYWRLHGIGNAYHVYTDDELRTLIARLPRTPETYVMFNNVPRVRDAQRFLALLRAANRP